MVHRVDDPDIDVLLNKKLWISANLNIPPLSS